MTFTQEAIHKGVGAYLSYLVYGDMHCLQQACHWLWIAHLTTSKTATPLTSAEVFVG